MKKLTRENTTQNISSRFTSASLAVISTILVAVAGLSAGWEVGMKDYTKCIECGVMVAKEKAHKKEVYKGLLTGDDTLKPIWFCQQHEPSFDYACNVNGEIMFFARNLDRRVTRTGDVGLYQTNIINRLTTNGGWVKEEFISVEFFTEKANH